MGEIARGLGKGSTFDFRDKVYTLAPWSYEIQAAFEGHLDARPGKPAGARAATCRARRPRLYGRRRPATSRWAYIRSAPSRRPRP